MTFSHEAEREAGAIAPGAHDIDAPVGGLTPKVRTLFARPGSGARGVMAVVLIAAGVWALFGGPFVTLVGESCAVFAVASLGQSLLFGSAGQIAFSGGAFMCIGAFTTGILTGSPLHAFPLTVIVSAVVGWIVGLISGLPGLRFRGLYLLLASLALQFIVSSVAQQYETAYHPAGLPVSPLTLGPLDLSSGRPLYLTLLVILCIAALFVWLVERTGVGLAWHALRESEIAAAISGIDIVRWKLYAFAASGAITAVAGSLYVYLVGRADYASYDITLSIALFTMIFIGGVRSRLGAVIGAVVITVVPYILQNDLQSWMSAVNLSAGWYLNNESEVNTGLFSLLFLVVVLFEPRGIEGILVKAENLIRRMAGNRSDVGDVG